jgi:hypothetical protein
MDRKIDLTMQKNSRNHDQNFDHLTMQNIKFDVTFGGKTGEKQRRSEEARS